MRECIFEQFFYHFPVKFTLSSSNIFVSIVAVNGYDGKIVAIYKTIQLMDVSRTVGFLDISIA